MNCVYCQAPLPAASRRDRRYCNNSCRAWASYWRGRNGDLLAVFREHPRLGRGRKAELRAHRLGDAIKAVQPFAIAGQVVAAQNRGHHLIAGGHIARRSAGWGRQSQARLGIRHRRQAQRL